MELPQGLFDLYYQTVDDMIDSNFGVNCTVYYPQKNSNCPNCIFNTSTKSSSNQYKSGGPIPFTSGLCPYCDGVGYTSVQATETIKLRAYFDKKSWIKVPVEIKIPDSMVQTIGHITDMPKCKSCDFITIASDLAGYESFNYRLDGEPIPHGFRRNKYFVAFWSRYK